MEEFIVNSWENLVLDIGSEDLLTIMMSCVEKWL